MVLLFIIRNTVEQGPVIISKCSCNNCERDFLILSTSDNPDPVQLQCGDTRHRESEPGMKGSQ